MKRHFRFMALLCLVGAIVALPLIAGGKQEKGTEIKPVVMAQGTDVMSLDPQIHDHRGTSVVLDHMFNSLLTRNEELEIVPSLATSWEQTNPTTWRFNLREGVKFHNGEPFNAESVKFTFDRMNKLGSKSPIRGSFSAVDRVEVVDEYTADIITKQPFPALQAFLTMYSMLPPKYIEEVGDEQFNNKPVGTGPYKFVNWIRDDRVIMESNEEYWDGAPEIKNVVFRAMPETQSRLAGLITGEVDIAYNIPPDLAESTKKSEDYSFKSTTTIRVLYLKLRNEGVLEDKRVRQAINYAIDLDSIIEHILQGYGERVATLFPKEVYGWNPNLEPYPYDPAKARQLLAEAGYPDGIDISFDGPTGRFMRDVDVCQAIAEQLNQADIRTDLTIKEFGTHITDILNKTCAPVWMLAWGNPILDPDQYMWSHFHGGEAFCDVIGDAKLDKMLEEARFETDSEKREKMYFEIERYVLDQAYFVPLYMTKDLQGVSSRIDHQPRRDEGVQLWKVNLAR